MYTDKILRMISRLLIHHPEEGGCSGLNHGFASRSLYGFMHRILILNNFVLDTGYTSELHYELTVLNIDVYYTFCGWGRVGAEILKETATP